MCSSSHWHNENQQEVGWPRASFTAWGIAPWTNPRHSTAPPGFPGRAMTRDRSTTAARPRERIAFGVISREHLRMVSPKPGISTRMMVRIASGVTSRTCDPGAARTQDETTTLTGKGQNAVADAFLLVGNDRLGDDIPAVFPTGPAKSGPALVFVLAGGDPARCRGGDGFDLWYDATILQSRIGPF